MNPNRQSSGLRQPGAVDIGQADALEHISAAEAAAPVIENLPADTAERPIHHIGIIGAGTMGSGIALAFLFACIPAILVDTTEDALARGTAHIRQTIESRIARGKLSIAEGELAMGRLQTSLELDALVDEDLIIEAAYEDMEVKKTIFTRLDSIAKPGAILASNTSYLDINEIASATSRPAEVVGLHFFSPAHVMKLVEVVRGAKTDPAVLATAVSLAVKIGKIPVVAGVCRGFIGNRMLIPRRLNAEALLLEGATPAQIDRVHTDFGMPMGPFQATDLAGVDVGWHRNPEQVHTIREALCAAGRLGQKVGAGFYDYDTQRKPSPSPAATAIIDRFRDASKIVARTISEDEIIVRTMYTMINEGLWILEEGIAQRSSDIDVVWVNGYGWPRATGGPMYWAHRIGLDQIAAGLNRYRSQLGADFKLSPTLQNG